MSFGLKILYSQLDTYKHKYIHTGFEPSKYINILWLMHDNQYRTFDVVHVHVVHH